MLRTDGRGVVTNESEQRLKVTQHCAGLANINGLRAENLLVFRGELGHGSLSFSTSKPSSFSCFRPRGLHEKWYQTRAIADAREPRRPLGAQTP